MENEIIFFRDEYWVSRGSPFLLTYIGPALKDTLNIDYLKKYLKKRKALGAIWNYDSDYTSEGPWYRCICDIPGYCISNIESKNVKHNITRGIKRCILKEVEYSWLAENGYDVYSAACTRYTNYQVMDKKEFSKSLSKYQQEKKRIAFGVFIENTLIAYMTLFVCEKTVFGDTAHFDPKYTNAYPMYFLYYSIANKLINQGYQEFDRGTKPLVHQTNIDEFLQRMGFRLSYCRLGFYLVWPFSIIIPWLYVFLLFFKRFIPNSILKSLEALISAKEISKITARKRAN